MTVELTGSVEAQLRDLATKQGRNVGALVEEALRTYLESAAITDLEPAEIAEAQEALLGELGGLPVGLAPGRAALPPGGGPERPSLTLIRARRREVGKPAGP